MLSCREVILLYPQALPAGERGAQVCALCQTTSPDLSCTSSLDPHETSAPVTGTQRFCPLRVKPESTVAIPRAMPWMSDPGRVPPAPLGCMLEHILGDCGQEGEAARELLMVGWKLALSCPASLQGQGHPHTLTIGSPRGLTLPTRAPGASKWGLRA